MVHSQSFGRLPSGEEVTLFTITNGEGESVGVLDYGATLYAASVKDRKGTIGDVVLGAPDAASIPNCSYMGSIIGRYSNRVPGGKCVIDGKPVQLEQNLGDDFVHGASGNYAKKLFHSTADNAGNRVVFTLRDLGEGGFGNAMDVTVTYAFGDDHCLALTIEMKAEETTIVNPACHAYFMLDDGDARDMQLRIPTAVCATKGPSGAPDGGFRDGTNTPADFLQAKTLRQAMATHPEGYFQQEPIGYDEYYIYSEDGMQLKAELTSATNGRRLSIYADAPGLVFYNPACRVPEHGKNGATYGGYNAVCLQPGFVPNAINCPAYASPVCGKGESYRLQIRYQFSIA